MTHAATWTTKCVTIDCRNERTPGDRLCESCRAALAALPPAAQFATKARLPELFDETPPPPPPSPAPLGTTREARARKTDRGTSHAATRRAARNITDKHRAVLSVFRAHGNMHDEALVVFYRAMRTEQLARGFGPQLPDLTDSSIRTRRGELVALGYVRDTGHTTKTARGGDTTVWGLVETTPSAPSDEPPPPTTTTTAGE